MEDRCPLPEHSMIKLCLVVVIHVRQCRIQNFRTLQLFFLEELSFIVGDEGVVCKVIFVSNPTSVEVKLG